MSTKLLSALLLSAVLFAPGMALADPPADRCDLGASPGDTNKFLHGFFGTPGQVGQLPFIDANQAAALQNLIRKENCEPPGQEKKGG